MPSVRERMLIWCMFECPIWPSDHRWCDWAYSHARLVEATTNQSLARSGKWFSSPIALAATPKKQDIISVLGPLFRYYCTIGLVLIRGYASPSYSFFQPRGSFSFFLSQITSREKPDTLLSLSCRLFDPTRKIDSWKIFLASLGLDQYCTYCFIIFKVESLTLVRLCWPRFQLWIIKATLVQYIVLAKF